MSGKIQSIRSIRKYIQPLSLAFLGVFLSTQAGHGATLAGTVEVVWGDSLEGSDIAYTLVPNNGRSRVRLDLRNVDLSEAGGVAGISGKNVTIEYNSAVLPSPESAVEPVIPVTDLELNPSGGGATTALTEAKFVSLMCKFSDVSNEPNDINYFDNMYGNQPGYLDHYWQEVSSNEITVNGSYAVGWYILPYPRSHYVTGTGFHDADLTALWYDCTAAADADVDFSDVLGINMMFNDDLDCCAWGGSRYATLDGVTKSWPSTWNPPWAASNVGVIKHEMGHAFGLPHSNNADDDGSPYDNPWTVMSDVGNYAFYEPTLGSWGKHLNSFEKSTLNLFSAAETYTGTAYETTIRLDPINNYSASNGNYRFANVPAAGVGGIDYYTVEVRANGSSGGVYDVNLPASTVIIHSVDTSRNEPAWLVDSDNPPSDGGDGPGVQWLPGETFEDVANNVKISVIGQFGNSFDVTIGYLSGTEECNGKLVTVNLNIGDTPTNGNDVILGTPGPDVIDALDGNDTICGEGGGDTISGGPGADTILGGAGADTINGDSGIDTIYGQNGSDTIDGGSQRDILYGNGGADTMLGNGGNDEIFGGIGDDTINGGNGDDTINGEDGDDELSGDIGNDTINGGLGKDTILGGTGADTLNGDGGIDTIYGQSGNDTIDGGSQRDILYGNGGADFIVGNGGDDDIFGGIGEDTVYGGKGDDTISGEDGDDYLSGNSDNDTIYGGYDNDYISGDDGEDYLYGDAGSDTIEGGQSDDYIGGGSQRDFLFGDAGEDTIFGNGGNDEISGGADDDDLYGSAGNDELLGNSGDDLLFGGQGMDVLIGGTGLGDACNGGGGLADIAANSCESTSNIP